LVVIREELERLEAEATLLLQRVFHYKQRQAEILERYGVSSAAEIPQWIKQGKLDGHPAYEDYLDWLGYQDAIQKALGSLAAAMEQLQRP